MSSTIEQFEITALELKKRLEASESLIVLDIREPFELTICKLDNSIHIPMGELVERMSELDRFKDAEVVVYCRSGHRSHHCAEYMRSKGFKAHNLAGGILAWSQDVDPSVRMY